MESEIVLLLQWPMGPVGTNYHRRVSVVGVNDACNTRKGFRGHSAIPTKKHYML